MSGWKNSAVSLIDLVGIRTLAKKGNTAATEVMRTMHGLVVNEMRTALPTHDRAYIWNDSVLLLAFLDHTSATPERVLREVDGLKRKIDTMVKPYGLPNSYAVAVKGQVFPSMGLEQQIDDGKRAVIIEASSYALANCFLIQEDLGKLKAQWYVDSRLARRIRADSTPSKVKPAALLPGNEVREVHVYSNYLWRVPRN